LRSGDPFTDRTNRLRRFLISTTLHEPLEWIATLLEGNVVAVTEVKKERAGDILLYGSIYGSGALVSTLTLKRVETSSTGVTMLVCEPAS
jgi:hypothetical protein